MYNDLTAPLALCEIVTMNNRRTKQDRIWKTLLVTGGLTLGVVGMTVMSAGASPPVVEEVDRATDVAERAAAAESSVRTLRLEAANDEAAHSGRQRAEAMLDAARQLGPLSFPEVPDDWVAAGLDLSEATRNDDGELVQVLDDGSRVIFTVDADVQQYLESMLQQTPVPHGSVVLIDPPSGRVVAKAHQSRADSDYQYSDFSRNASPPSASVFKVITAAALMAEADQTPHQEVCYHGGTRGLTQRNITGDPNFDNRCDNLEGALARSINSLIAKQTYHNLSADHLLEWAERFGYNDTVPFELPVEPSTAEFGDDPYERARAAAGFWHTHLSPLHGALIGAALANDGVMMQPTIIERYEAPDGRVVFEAEPQVWRTVMEPEMARKLGEMMTTTAESGTARRYFGHRRAFPNSVEVSGKTGTLSNQNPFLRFTWFVGYGKHSAWEDHPGVAIGSVMANEPTWHMVGPQAASEGLRHYFNLESSRRAAQDDAVVTR